LCRPIDAGSGRSLAGQPGIDLREINARDVVAHIWKEIDMLTRDEVKKVAVLGRLNLTEAEVDEFTEQLGSVLSYIEVLDELDVSNVEPMAHAADVTNVFRTDTVKPSLDREAALSNAPKSDGQFFLVPQILENA
jgi:aspartyl-tRNA(Asn)/glutamyl-tRNA(Gln) amidotransferase subunit C